MFYGYFLHHFTPLSAGCGTPRYVLRFTFYVLRFTFYVSRLHRPSINTQRLQRLPVNLDAEAGDIG